jgi:hypothetical protein
MGRTTKSPSHPIAAAIFSAHSSSLNDGSSHTLYIRRAARSKALQFRSASTEPVAMHRISSPRRVQPSCRDEKLPASVLAASVSSRRTAR